MSRLACTAWNCLSLLPLFGCVTAGPPPNYERYVWPLPPDKPRIRLEDILLGRADVLAKKAGLERALLGAAPQNAYDWFKRPFAVEFDKRGRILVTDAALGALFRLDRASRRADVFGTKGPIALKTPLGIGMGPEGTAYVADIGLKKVVAFDEQGKVTGVYGREGELANPTDAAVSPDGARLFVADSKAHRIVVFELKTGKQVASFGKRGEGEGEFAFPTSLAFDRSGNLLVVDQINTRIQILSEAGSFVDRFGEAGVGFGDFVRPKDVAVDEAGFVYVTDAAFGNFQVFDSDLRLLTFVGSSGLQPGQFQITSGIAVRSERIAVVDQLGARVQVFRYIVPKDAP